MHKRFFVAGYRFFFGALAVAAIMVQFLHEFDRLGHFPVNFFQFFTIQSNILAAVIFLIAGVGALLQKRNNTFAFLRGAATVYMTMTGVVYVLLLSGLGTLQTTIPWVNHVLHHIMPVVVLTDWFIDPPLRRITFYKALAWLTFPLAYLVYSLIRGSIVGWYPYPFLDPREHGYGRVAVMSLIIALGATTVVWLVAWVTRYANKSDKKRR
jgi:hypothetical protein